MGNPRGHLGCIYADEKSTATGPHPVMGPEGACSGSHTPWWPLATMLTGHPQRDPETLDTAGNAEVLCPAASVDTSMTDRWRIC